MVESSSVFRLSRKLGVEWPTIHAAAEAAAERKASLQQGLSRFTSEDTSITVFGSLARGELTSGSDLDWVLLVDGFANPEHLDASLAIEEYLKTEEQKGPGAEATFGGLVFSHDLINYIGGGDDGNPNLTRRMLLLLESASIGREDAYNRVLNNILKRYIVEDFGWMNARNPMNIPRFLQNDISRYWRTLAVDFACKRRQRGGRGWALRTAKLRLSRKLTYSAGLLMCFNCANDPDLQTGRSGPADSSAAHALVAHLAKQVRMTPLEIFADLFFKHEQLEVAAKALFSAYDQFLGILDDEESRLHLDTLIQSKIADDKIYQHVREIGHQFQAALDGVFFSPDDAPELFKLTKTYGVF